MQGAWCIDKGLDESCLPQVEIANRERTVLEIDLDDVAAVRPHQDRPAPSDWHPTCMALMWCMCERVLWGMQYHDTETLLDGLENNTKRFIKIVCEAADDAMPPPERHDFEEDIYDILFNQVQGAPGHSAAVHFHIT